MPLLKKHMLFTKLLFTGSLVCNSFVIDNDYM